MKLNINEQAKKTETTYKLLKVFIEPTINMIFNPIVLNQEKSDIKGPIMVAPNHRSTLDPFFICVSSERPVHFVALKRFFDGKDSIFNNSKNPILCKMTVTLFNGIGSIPVIRERDVDFSDALAVKEYNAEGKKTVANIMGYLNSEYCVGIFPEETTNKNPEICEIQDAKKGFVHFAKKSSSAILPISITWIPKELNIRNRVIINYRNPFVVGKMSKDEAINFWHTSVEEGITENKELISELSKIDNAKSKQVKQLVLKYQRRS